MSDLLGSESCGSACPCGAITAESLSLHYGSTPAFRDLSVEIPRCEITALIGPSGCGKTSFLSSINRLTDLVPNCEVQGRLQVEDLDVLSPSLDVVALRKRVGMIFQKPNPFAFSIAKNLALPLREHGVRDRDEIERRSRAALEDVGLWDEVRDRLRNDARDLSGGQQQRLCLARALVLEPEVLLLDEPCSALDPIASATVEDHLISLRGRFTVVIVTHNLAQARRVADRVVVMWPGEAGGQIVEEGPTEIVFEHSEAEITRSYIQGLRG
ncbi:MAG: phosphate ABC transporter ATP-binding protein [Planctomycetota bacterium]